MSDSIEKMRQDIAELTRERDERDLRAGFCMVKHPIVKSPFAKELLTRIEKEANPFLRDYAAILVESKEWPQLPDSLIEKVAKWKEHLPTVDVSEVQVSSRSMRYGLIFDRIIKASSDHDPLYWTQWIYELLEKSKISYSLYEAQPEDYEYDFDAELEKMKEMDKLWRQALDNYQKFA